MKTPFAAHVPAIARSPECPGLLANDTEAVPVLKAEGPGLAFHVRPRPQDAIPRPGRTCPCCKRPAPCGPGSRAPAHPEQTCSLELEGTGVQVPYGQKGLGTVQRSEFSGIPPTLGVTLRLVSVGVPHPAGYARVTRPNQLRQWAEYRIAGDHAHTWHCRAPSEPKVDTGSSFPLVVTGNYIELRASWSQTKNISEGKKL